MLLLAMRVLITGGAGFIGSQLARYLASRGHSVTAFDNLARRGSERNLEWLRETGQPSLAYVKGDVCDADAVRDAVERARPEAIYHLAAQVAVTTSVEDPRTDFAVNAAGTVNVLEAARTVGAAVFFTSTNKVYGGMEQVGLVEEATRYRYAELPHGVSETQPLDFHSPYGCSKGAADQYVLDYARIYGLATTVFRMSCIYGTRQFGNEDQGWVAHFVIAAALDRPLSIYGDGKQVRDLLFIDDLLAAFERATATARPGVGRVFNIGGGPGQTIAVWTEFGPLLERLVRRKIDVTYGDWRPGDQRIYVSDIRKAERELGWRPTVSVEDGIARLHAWVAANPDLFH
jgi:CDP-paratose 2-epimerase